MKVFHVTLKVNIIIQADDDIPISDVIDEMDYDFIDTTTKASIVNSEIVESEVTDSR